MQSWVKALLKCLIAKDVTGQGQSNIQVKILSDLFETLKERLWWWLCWCCGWGWWGATAYSKGCHDNTKESRNWKYLQLQKKNEENSQKLKIETMIMNQELSFNNIKKHLLTSMFSSSVLKVNLLLISLTKKLTEQTWVTNWWYRCTTQEMYYITKQLTDSCKDTNTESLVAFSNF